MTFNHLPDSPQAIPPLSFGMFAMEPLRAAMEYAGYGVMDHGALPRGDGHAVVVFPGLGTNEFATRPLLSFCDRLGYQAIDWGQGFNVGPLGEVNDWLDALCTTVRERTQAHDGPISLVGWSLGGVYAREVAKRLPGAVRQVITIGTPFACSAETTALQQFCRLLNGAAPPEQLQWLEMLRTPPPVPTSSIYSRSDGVVAWESCVQAEPADHVETIEVEGSHCGMPWNPAVLQVVANRLAQPLGSWRPFTNVGAPASPRLSRRH